MRLMPLTCLTICKLKINQFFAHVQMSILHWIIQKSEPLKNGIDHCIRSVLRGELTYNEELLQSQ